MLKRTYFFLITLLWCVTAQAQLVLDDAMTPTELVQNVLLGGGVTVSNVRYNGVLAPATAQVGSGSFTYTGTDLGLGAGLILSSGDVLNAVGPSSNFSGDDNDTGSDPDLEEISGGIITDRAVLEFDFVPTGDSLKFRYVFASEEYPEFICSFNDAFGFFLSGPGLNGPFIGNAVNIALVPGTTIPVTINNVNNGLNNDPNDPACPAMNPQYYVDNEDGDDIAFDGYTVVLEAIAIVQCGQTYHIKLAVGDAGGDFGGDTTYDSAVFLEAGSFTSTGQIVPELVSGTGIIGNTMTEGCVPVELLFRRQGDIALGETVNISVGGSSTPGVDYTPALPSQLEFAAGDSVISFLLDVPLDADGPETMEITVDQLVSCAGGSLQTIFLFNIDSPPPLITGAMDGDALCGETLVLDPLISGGVGFYSYLWSTGETTPTITVSPSETSMYSFTVTDSCSVAPLDGSITITMPVYDALVLDLTPDLAIPCLESDDIAVLSATGGNGDYMYTWTNNGVELGTGTTINVPAGPSTWYTLLLTDGCGVSLADSVLVTQALLDPIEMVTTEDITVICQGDSAWLEVTDITGGNGVYTLEWLDEDGLVLSAEPMLPVSVPVEADYTITVSDQCGTVNAQTISTLLPNYAQFGITMNPDRLICYGEGTELQVTVQGGSGYYTIDWDGLGATDPILEVAPLEETLYRVFVTDQCGEVLTDAVNVEVEAVYVDIVINNQGQDDWFFQAATVPVARTFVWDLGDGTDARGKEVAHSYLDLEDHWVTLRTRTNNGCPGVDSVLITPPAHLYFPNAFTPDGDGINETFGPVGHNLDLFEMVIFDRWGELIYSSEDQFKPWDGRVNGGAIAATGVYVYKYKARGHYFPATEGYGHVTLLQGKQE